MNRKKPSDKSLGLLLAERGGQLSNPLYEELEKLHKLGEQISLDSNETKI